MGLFDWLSGKRRDVGGSSRMGLRLQYPPTPQHAARHAQIAVDAARNVTAVHLDYSPESLAEVDKIVGAFHTEGLRPDQIGETVFSFGCYVGEVMVRHDRGVWKMPRETKLPEALKEGNNMMVIEFPNGDVCNPIGKAFKLLELGEGESLSFFYQAFAPKG